MIVLATAVFGILLGLRAAIKRDGNRADKWQYCAVYGMLFAVLGLFITIFVHNSLV